MGSLSIQLTIFFNDKRVLHIDGYRVGHSLTFVKPQPLISPMKLKLLISYDGTEFGGWQRQKSGPPTIQGSLEGTLSRVFDQPVTICGAGRTDRGVHARGQVAHFWAPKVFEGGKLLRALNDLTPRGIAVHDIWEVPADFHAIASAQSKTYIYDIYNAPVPSAFRERFSLWRCEEFDLELLNSYSQVLLGHQDFKSFQNQGSPVLHTERVIFEAGWERLPGNRVIFRITGNGFLRQMVRNIVGTLLKLHRQKAPPSTLREMINSLDRQRTGPTAPPQGLYLDSIAYLSLFDN